MYVFILLSLTDEGENKFEVIYASDTVLVVSVVNKDKNKKCGEIQLPEYLVRMIPSYSHRHGHETFPLSVLLFRNSAWVTVSTLLCIRPASFCSVS